MPADGTGETWNENTPLDNEQLSGGPLEFVDLRKGVRIRMNKEHVNAGNSSAGGEHENGSAKAWYQSSTPTLRPDGVTALTNSDKGRIYFDANRRPMVYDGTVNGFMLTATYSRQAVLRELQTSGTAAGGALAATWNKRDLNTESSDPDGIVTVSSGVMTLGVGTYRFRAFAVAFGVGGHQLRLRRTNNTAATMMVGASVNAEVITVGSKFVQNTCIIEGPFSVTVAGTTFELQHWTANAKATDGLGHALSNGENELYCQVIIDRIDAGV